MQTRYDKVCKKPAHYVAVFGFLFSEGLFKCIIVFPCSKKSKCDYYFKEIFSFIFSQMPFQKEQKPCEKAHQIVMITTFCP